MTLLPTSDLLAGYEPIAGHHDELFDGSEVRPQWRAVADSLLRLGRGELSQRTMALRRLLVDDGVSYNVISGERSAVRSWTLDPVPMVVPAEEWAGLEAGLVQRSELLDRLLADLYGPRRLIADGTIPPEVVYGHPGFLRACDGIQLPGRHQLIHAAYDVGRAPDGTWTLISDRTQAPSGVGYARENRVALSRVMPDLYRDLDVVRLAPFFLNLRAALERVAPASADAPRIVVLTPGPRSETAFEHGSLASYLGYPLVQGADLRVRDGRVWVRTLGRLEPVHVILRRVDAAWCDPLELLPDSTLGAPGLLEACRVGNVSVVNALGSGALENPGLMPFLADACRALLGEDLRLPSVTTWWCGDEGSRRHVAANLDRLVLKSLSATGTRTVSGWTLSGDELDALRSRIEARPHLWVAQEPMALGSAPTLVDGRLVARRSILRCFVAALEDGYTVMPGGLTRIAPDAGEGLITNQQGAWNKDTWVLAREPERVTGVWLEPIDAPAQAHAPATAMSQRAAENLFWLSRYAERAEATVRQLRVVSDRLTEFPAGSDPAGNACVEVLLAALTTTTGTWPGFLGDGAAEAMAAPSPEIRSLLVDPRRSGTVAHSVQRLLDAAAEVRDQLSTDTWLLIGHLDRDLASLDGQMPVAEVTGALGRVMTGMLALAGLAGESMVRDDGWQFMEAGRRLERGLQICALLGATVAHHRDDAADGLVLESVLTSSESIVTYRRRYRSHGRVETLLDLLLLDAGNPRSLAFQVKRLADAVDAMPPAEQSSTVEIGALLDELATLVALADTNQLARPADGELPDLVAFLGQVHLLLTRLGDHLDAAHFSHQLPQRAVVPVQSLGSAAVRPSVDATR